MKIILASKKTEIEDLKNLVNDPNYSLSKDISTIYPHTAYLAEKLTNYALPPSKFEVITNNQDQLYKILEDNDYKEVSWDVLYDALLHGGGGESWYVNSVGEVKVKKIDPLNLIAIQETPYSSIWATVYWEILGTEKPKKEDDLTFWDNKKVFVDNGMVTYVFVDGEELEEERIVHNLGVPAINVLVPFKGKAFFDKQLSSIRDYENAFLFLGKETRNALNILIMSGKAESIQQFGDLRVIENVDMSGEGKPELLTKTPEYEGQFKFKDAVEKRIAKETGIVDFSNQDEAGQDASGEALKLRLITIEDKCSKIFTKMNKFLKTRHKIVSNLGKRFALDEEKVKIKLETNMPQMLAPMVQAYGSMLGLGLISKQTAQEKLGLVPEDEEERIKKEEGFDDMVDAHTDDPSPARLGEDRVRV